MKALFRCDAGVSIGLGHVSRGLALAEAFREERVEAVFAGKFGPAARAHIETAGFPVVEMEEEVNTRGDVNRLRQVATSQGASFVAVDSYRADESYLQALKRSGLSVAVIDDFKALSRYDCEVLLNFTVGAKRLGYPADGPRLLLGPEYFLCRQRMCQARPQSLRRNRAGDIHNLLVAIAGEDPMNLAGRLVRLLAACSQALCLRVVVGVAFAEKQEIMQRLESFAPGSQCLSGLPDLADSMIWADACIAGGGLIKYEAAFMGVPVAVLSRNAGQASETVAFAREGLAFDLGLVAGLDDDTLRERLDLFISDRELRAGLAGRGRQVFPDSPTKWAAAAIVRVMKNAASSRSPGHVPGTLE